MPAKPVRKMSEEELEDIRKNAVELLSAMLTSPVTQHPHAPRSAHDRGRHDCGHRVALGGAGLGRSGSRSPSRAWFRCQRRVKTAALLSGSLDAAGRPVGFEIDLGQALRPRPVRQRHVGSVRAGDHGDALRAPEGRPGGSADRHGDRSPISARSLAEPRTRTSCRRR